MMKNRRAKSDKGFTLVELLVVIGIIAILISVLLPSLATARRSAATVQCLSNLRNLHNYLLMYAGDYKNATPVARQDTPEVNGVPQNVNNAYWQDMLFPYVLKKQPGSIFNLTAAEASSFHNSVLWCPTWRNEHPELNPVTSSADRFKSGYAMNLYLGFKSDYPNPDAMLPPNQLAVRSSSIIGSMTSAANVGKYYKRNEIRDSASKMIIADTNLWIFGMSLTDANGTLVGQLPDSQGLEHSATAPGPNPGAMNYDRYRHGKRSSLSGTRMDTKGGKIAYNVLFVDGHAATLNSIQDGYKAVRMRYP